MPLFHLGILHLRTLTLAEIDIRNEPAKIILKANKKTNAAMFCMYIVT